MSNGTYDLKWGQDLAAKITPQIKPEVDKIRVARPLIPIVPGTSRYEATIPSLTLDPGPPLSIPVSQTVATVRISLEFLLKQEQFPDEVAMSRLALRAGSDLATAEEFIVLHGKDAAAFLAKQKIPVSDDNKTLKLQDGLFLTPPNPIPQNKLIVDSVLEGIQKLEDDRQYGPYCVIVSPDLHREGMTPIAGSGLTQISPILPRLRENGFQPSTAAPNRTGVIFSLGGAAIELVIPWDAHVECRKVEGDATFVVVEQFRLRINDPRAVVTLS
jgi:uncharacterized linocin/CFP29 family protein